jgi:hypothetical protein
MQPGPDYWNAAAGLGGGPGEPGRDQNLLNIIQPWLCSVENMFFYF